MLLEVGRIGRAHGLRGEVTVKLVTERTSRLDPGSVLSTDRGRLTVQASRPHQKGWIVAFAQLDTREEAERWRGTVLRAEAVVDPSDDELWVHQVVGASVELVDGTAVGTVESVQPNPAADLLVLDGGALVPVVFVVHQEPSRIVIDPPEGLLDL
jgi:16S rRNA processing protein RimM